MLKTIQLVYNRDIIFLLGGEKVAYERKNNARLTAVTNNEVKDFITKNVNAKGESISNFMLVNAIDKLLDLEKERAKNVVTVFRNVLLVALGREGIRTDKLETIVNATQYFLWDNLIPDNIEKEQKLAKIAIEGFLFDNIDPQKPRNDDEVKISAIYEMLLKTMQEQGIIDEDQANERSLLTSFIDDKEEPINNEFQT